MPETVMDQIVASLRRNAQQLYPENGELRNVRIVGHTPKQDHFIYDVVIDFEETSQRVAAKVYRNGRAGSAGHAQAVVEAKNLDKMYQIANGRGLAGVPRPLGDFADHSAIVAEKIPGVPLQSIIMKAALLPGFSDTGMLEDAAHKAGSWLRQFHKATAEGTVPLDSAMLLKEVEKLCESCKGEGLDDASCRVILNGVKSALPKSKRNLPASAVLCDFTPLNVIVSEQGVGVADYAKMKERGISYTDAAQFLACVEALEKYPFCNRAITGRVQEVFLESYGVPAGDEGVVRVLKMKALLAMFAQGRTVKESALRKKVMWANVMKKFINQAAQRSLAPAA